MVLKFGVDFHMPFSICHFLPFFAICHFLSLFSIIYVVFSISHVSLFIFCFYSPFLILQVFIFVSVSYFPLSVLHLSYQIESFLEGYVHITRQSLMTIDEDMQRKGRASPETYFVHLLRGFAPVLNTTSVQRNAGSR